MTLLGALGAAKRFLVHRVTVLALIVALVACALLALLVPATPITWDSESLLHYLSLDHPDHLLTTYGFAALLLAFTLSLAISCWEQSLQAWHRTFAPSVAGSERTVEGATEERVTRILREEGFRPVRRAGGCVTWTLHPWANWGSALLHAGLLVSLISFLVYVLTERQGVLRIGEGEELAPGTPWSHANQGLLAEPFELPVGVRLDRVVPDFRDDDSLKSLSVELVLLGDGEEPHRVAPNDSHYHAGYRMYHPGAVGHAFDLDVVDAEGRSRRVTLDLPLPRSRWVAGYANFHGGPLAPELKAKYYLAADRSSMADRDPLLVLRRVEGGEVLDELSLRVGEAGRLGPVSVTLVGVRRWTAILFDAGTGMPSVLSGFFVMMLGALLLYGAVPRAVAVRWTGERCVIAWRAFTREEALFSHELDALAARCGGGSRP